jgi:hypothetical protein
MSDVRDVSLNMYTIEYILCYKEAFALGMATGLVVATLYNKYVTYSLRT